MSGQAKTSEAERPLRRSERADDGSDPAAGLARLWRDYSLTIALLAVFLVVLALHTIAAWFEYANEQQDLGLRPDFWGYLVYWAESTFQNWQSEFLQSLIIVVFTAWFVHKGSAESKDSQEEMQASLQRIERRLERLEAAEDEA
jgi:hypothetical protein